MKLKDYFIDDKIYMLKLIKSSLEQDVLRINNFIINDVELKQALLEIIKKHLVEMYKK